MKYWFRPKKFFKWFAAYYPASIEGWVITLALLSVAIYIFDFIDSASHSGSDTLMNFAPFAVVIGLIFDLLCFEKGEYPSWWTR